MSDAKTVSGKVTSAQAAGKFTAKNGKDAGKLKYKFDIVLDNGATGQLTCLESELNGTDCPIAVGETHEFNVYTSTNPEYPDNWYLRKAKAEGGWKGGKQWTPDPERESRKERWAKQIMITRQACLNTAGLLIANGAEGGATLPNIQTLAEALEVWVKRGMDLKVIAAGPVQNGAPAQATVTNDEPAAYRRPAPLADVPDPFV